MKNILGLLIVVFVLLSGVMIVGGWGIQEDYIRKVEKREPRRLGVEDLKGFYKEPTAFFRLVDEVVSDRFPFRGSLIQSKSEFDFSSLGRNDYENVYRGKSGWLFYKQDDLGYLLSDGQNRPISSILTRVESWHVSQGREFRFIVAPSKQYLYPEYLPPAGMMPGVGAADQFELMFSGLSESFPNLLRNLEEAKATESERSLYFKEDTHHSFAGAMVMAKTVVNSLKEGIWEEDAVFLKGTHNQLGDLARMIGVSSLTRSVEVLGVKREGVTVSVEQLSDRVSWDAPLRYKAFAKGDVPLIQGRVLFFHDSFVGSFLREPLAQYFEDVIFVHYRECKQARWRELIQDCDSVVYEVVARELPNLLRMLERRDKGSISVRFGVPDGVYRNYGGFVDRIAYDPEKERLTIEGWFGYEEGEDYLSLVVGGMEAAGDPSLKLTYELYERPDVTRFLKDVDGVLSSGYRILLDARFTPEELVEVKERVSVSLVPGSGKKTLLRKRTN